MGNLGIDVGFSEREQDENYFLKTQGVVPLKSEFKPTMKVLSRKPASAGVAQLGLNDDDEDDDSSKTAMTPEERKQKAQKEREEKQRAYEERRRELFGKDSTPSTSSNSRKGASPRNQSRNNRNNDSRPSSSASSRVRQLFDPNESAKPENLRPQKRESQLREIHPIREPRAPDGDGSAGFGAPRRDDQST